MKRSWPTRLLGGLLLAAVILGGVGCSKDASSPAELASSVGGPFSLINQDGARVDQRILRGKWTAVFFGYTFCPDVCPTTLTALGQAVSQMGAKAKAFQVVFITVDPDRDTPAQLKTYLSSPSFPKTIVGLTGTPQEVAKVASAYHVYYRKAGEGRDYAVDHTSILYLMDPRGVFHGPLGFGVPPAEMARQISQAMDGD